MNTQSDQGDPARDLVVFTPRELKSANLGQELIVEGVVTKAFLPKEKLQESSHRCPATGKGLVRTYADSLQLATEEIRNKRDNNKVDESDPKVPTPGVIPKKDHNGNELVMEWGYSKYIDHQQLQIQEMPETAPAGQLPRSIDVFLEEEGVDTVKPGDRVRITGMYLPDKRTGLQPDTDAANCFHCVLVAQGAPTVISRDAQLAGFSPEEAEEWTKQAQQTDPAEWISKLTRSVASGLHGLEAIKQTILLQLVGGVEKMEGSHRRRGDINVLLVGDPSTGKSQVLRFVHNIAPLGIQTTGRGASGVGLTAAVVWDKGAGDRTLAAGAMVLGDRGIVCIDEFDKMGEADRVQMHEAMEQGTVSIAKAGIRATLNSRCAVLAAANPAYGSWKPQYRERNVSLPESLQSRFDLRWPIREAGTDAKDRELAEAVMANHSGHMQMEPEMSLDQLRQFIRMAKEVVPLMTEPACRYIQEKYLAYRNEWRDKETKNLSWMDKTSRPTVRQLESLIRLATAHAKIRMSKIVDEQDAKMAAKLFEKSMEEFVNADLTTANDTDEVEEPVENGGDSTFNNDIEDPGLSQEGQGDDDEIPFPSREGEEALDEQDRQRSEFVRSWVTDFCMSKFRVGQQSVSLAEIDEASRAAGYSDFTRLELVTALMDDSNSEQMFYDADGEIAYSLSA